VRLRIWRREEHRWAMWDAVGEGTGSEVEVNGGETSTPSMAVQCQGRLAGGRDGVVVRDGVNMG